MRVDVRESVRHTKLGLDLAESLRRASDWLTDVAQVKETSLTVEDPWHFTYASWKGAMRGEYHAATRKWKFFCPVWHTGQAVKSLVLASGLLHNPKYIHAARLGADFILDKQVWGEDQPDHGLILAFENSGEWVNTSAILECMDGLLLLAEHDQSTEMRDRVVAAGTFVLDKLFMADEGLCRDGYHPAKHEVILPPPFLTRDNIGGRPLLDDAIWLKLHRLTGDPRFLDVAVRIAQTLVACQRPAGNWVDYAPCHPDQMSFHPRHTYWWGMPLLGLWRQTGRHEFLDTAMASARFTRQAMRRDGGYFRGTCYDHATGCINTDSFGHATSGSACAAIFFLEVFHETGDEAWLRDAERALDFCMKVQLRETSDPNLRGVILEKVLPPDGTDSLPYYIRDLGTIFFVQAAAKYLAKSVG
ncbi:MAG: hypothetical protein IT440_07385 [Phycisphaeraceae bacterium]|nr:hypothetical protein [Phycisphaeraceae bacterium]